MVYFVPLLEAAQNPDRVVDRRFTHVHLLEATLESWVFLNVLAVLVERGRTDHPELAASEHRLDHIAGIHGALGAACPNDRVEFVDERDDLAVGVSDLFQDSLQALFELAAVLCPGEHRGNVESDQPLVLETFGNVTVSDARGETFNDCGLADTRLTNEHRVVLRSA